MTFQNSISVELTESEIDLLRAMVSDEMNIASMGATDEIMSILTMLHLKFHVKKNQLNKID